MAKRGAANYLTDQNWDQEDEAEEAGTFTPVGEDVMKTRVVKKAKRRAESSDDSGGGAAVFKGFGGFGSKTAAAAPSFNFGTGTAKPLSGFGSLSNGTSATTVSAPPKGGLFTLAAQKAKDSESETKPSPSTSDATKPLTNGSGKPNTKYLQQLKCLNEAVSQWIKTHVEKNPYCILTPIFKDYEKHFAEIEKNNPEHSATATKEEPKASTESDSSKVTSSGGLKITSDTSSSTSTTVTSSGPTFKMSGESKFTPGGTGFSFGSPGASSVFGFKSGQTSETTSAKGFSFAATQPAVASTNTTGDDEEYVPPKPEVSTVTEEDAKYSVRCKLFYQKEGTWTERGLGNLYLKPCDGKTQLLIRADTNLGNILLNIMVASSMPAKRLGKNNVLIVCIPNPPLNPKDEDKKPVQMMIRVKTGEMADELLQKIDESKQ